MDPIDLKVLIADKLPPQAAERLEAAGATVVNEPTLKEDALRASLERTVPDVLIVRYTKVTATHFAAGHQLNSSFELGRGSIILTSMPHPLELLVANCPGMNAVAVAELTWGHILNADRRIADNVRDLRAGLWKKKPMPKRKV